MIIDLGYDYERLSANLRGYYQGRPYYTALVVLDWARSHHTGTRKDGRPEFSHQIMQASMLRSMPGLLHPELTHAVILAHDLDEDHEVDVEKTCATIRESTTAYIDGALGDLAQALRLMNKRSSPGYGTPMAAGVYYAGIQGNAIASIAKGLDRDHNLSTMIPTFRPEKIAAYIVETEEHTLPMLKAARKLFPQQAEAYYAIAHQIRYKLFMAKQYLALKGLTIEYALKS